MYERILVPVDGSAASDRGLDEALALAAKFGSKIRLLHVIDEASLGLAAGYAVDIGPLTTALHKGGEQVLAQAKARAGKRGIDAETSLNDTFTARVCDVVVQEALEWKADLIVIGTHGRRGASRLLLGSDAEQVLRLAPVPVLLVRDAALAPRGA
ncbi:MAG TPA: universal stress protein [Burkholderiaceae bacterium]|nr:universal stress protein [Burkholderiaceae bacterium]